MKNPAAREKRLREQARQQQREAKRQRRQERRQFGARSRRSSRRAIFLTFFLDKTLPALKNNAPRPERRVGFLSCRSTT
jgi:hypothetical protein